jgi:hypothetical protein
VIHFIESRSGNLTAVAKLWFSVDRDATMMHRHAKSDHHSPARVASHLLGLQWWSVSAGWFYW